MKSFVLHRKEVSANRVVELARLGANWLGIIGLASLVNFLPSAMRARLVFPVGLAGTYVPDRMAAGFARRALADGNETLARAAQTAAWIGCLAAIGAFFLLWRLTRKGSAACYTTGIVLYVIDTLVAVAFRQWGWFGLHLVTLLFLLANRSAVEMRAEAEAAIKADGPSSAPINI